jgi:valyl-tRNA synthetase
VDLGINELPKKFQKIINSNELIVKRLGRITNFNIDKSSTKTGKVVLSNNKLSISFGEDLNLEQLVSTLDKKIKILENQIKISENKLKNENFIKKAPKIIIKQEKDLLESGKSEYKNLLEIINSLK